MRRDRQRGQDLGTLIGIAAHYRRPLLAPPASSSAAMLEPIMARRIITFFT